MRLSEALRDVWSTQVLHNTAGTGPTERLKLYAEPAQDILVIATRHDGIAQHVAWAPVSLPSADSSISAASAMDTNVRLAAFVALSELRSAPSREHLPETDAATYLLG